MKHIYYLEFSYLIRKVKNYRPATRSTSRKMQRIYPYHFSLMFGWNGKLSLECEVTSLYGSRYYWNENNREVDVIIAKDRLIPIEVKETSKASPDDVRNLRYFMSKFGLKEGILIYNGEQDTIKDGGMAIKLVPAWKAFLDSADGIGKSGVGHQAFEFRYSGPRCPLIFIPIWYYHWVIPLKETFYTFRVIKQYGR